MMTDIFSSFDPATSSLHTSASPIMFWALSSMSLTILSSSLWLTPNRLNWLLSFPLSIMSSQIKQTFSVKIKGFPYIITSLFITLIMLNLMGLIPYIFSSTSHLILTLSFGLPCWLSLIISGATANPKPFIAHLLPSGAPQWLAPPLIIIETISTLVRFFTLSVRLMANMSAGHILLGLMGIYATSALFSSMTSTVTLLTIQSFYTIFEVAICFIQAYIFCLLLSLYSDDHPSSNM
uniref:ATP synthase subunit a n=1 Tax=Iphione sp. YZ-2018 TaxID=2153332 RepID=A0A343W6H4_9ANNE|nr:ATP synthase F0 subunit 6 [Iphione sp. YZ-2018]